MPRAGRRLRQLGCHVVAEAASAASATAADEAAGEAASPAALELTTAHGPLTLLQRQQYERDGFLVVRRFWEPGELQHLHEHYVEICRNAPELVKSSAARVTSLVRDINVVDGTHDLGELPLEYGVIKMNGFTGAAGEDGVFCRFARNEKQLRYVRQFVGSDELDTFSEMYVCKPPGLDATTRHPMHQDLLYVPRGERDAEGRLSAERHGYAAGNSARNGIVCAYTAVKRATVDNGCLVCLPGSHAQGLRRHAYPKEGQFVDPSGLPWVDPPDGKNNIGYFGCEGITADEVASLVPIELAPGDTVSAASLALLLGLPLLASSPRPPCPRTSSSACAARCSAGVFPSRIGAWLWYQSRANRCAALRGAGELSRGHCAALRAGGLTAFSALRRASMGGDAGWEGSDRCSRCGGEGGGSSRLRRSRVLRACGGQW